MDHDLEALEEKYISLYCSNYVRESIELFSSKREIETEDSGKQVGGLGPIRGSVESDNLNLRAD